MSKTSTDSKTKRTEAPISSPAKYLPNLEYVKKMRGELYERISSAKIFKDFYLEDITYPSKKIKCNFQMNFDKLKQEIAPLLIIDENQEKPELTKKIIEIKSKIEKCLISFLAKNTEIHNVFSDSDITTEEDQNEKEKKKTLKYVEMDYVVKSIEGKKINDCFKNLKNRNQELHKSFDILNDQKYNICFEMTVKNDDIKKKKIFQLYKYAIWINLLQDITNLIKNADKDVKNVFTQLLNKLETGYGLLDSKCKTILIIVCNGNIEKFNAIKETINDKNNKTKYLEKLMKECENKINLYCNYYAFQYDDNSKTKNQNEKEKEERQKERKEFENKLLQYQEEIKKYKEEKEKEERQKERKEFENKLLRCQEEIKKYKEEKEKNEKKIDQLEVQIEKDKENFEKRISEVKAELAEEKRKFESIMAEFTEEKKKFESITAEDKKELKEERGKLDKYREKFDQNQVSLIACLEEKNKLNFRILELERLLKENNISFE